MAAYSENVELFLNRYEREPELKKRVDEAVNDWPGTLENRAFLVEDVLIPIAKEEGLPFELADLRKYETHLKIQRNRDVDISEIPDEEYVYWLVDRGWEYDDSVFKQA